jgi:hypothetical protein
MQRGNIIPDFALYVAKPAIGAVLIILFIHPFGDAKNFFAYRVWPLNSRNIGV